MSLQIVVKNSAVTGKEPTAQQLANGEIALNYHADGPFLTCKDTNGVVRRITGVWINAVAPPNPTPGGLWFDISVNPPQLRVYQSAAVGWVEARGVAAATTVMAGIVELATNAETQDGVSTTAAVTPASLQSKLSDSTSTSSSSTIASSTAVKTADDLAAGAVPKTGYTSGQLLVGKADGTLAKTTLTAGGGITITNGDGAVTIATAGGGTVTGVTATSPLASTGGTSPDISIQDASTTQKGAVQLSSSTSSTSTSTAATPSAVKSAYDLANAAMPKSGGTFTGPVTIPTGSTITDYLTTASAASTYAPLASPTLTGQPYVNGSYRGNIVTLGGTAIDCSAGNFFTVTVNGNTTFTVSNVPASRSYTFVLEVIHTSGTITWFSGVIWPSATAPTLTTSRVHLFMFQTDNGGTTWRASSLINYAS